MTRPAPDLLTTLLKEVSRSFYLTLRVLPGAIRPQISLAYLLARATDTIADTGIIPLPQRFKALQMLRERILGENAAPLNLGELARSQASPSERTLLERIEDVLTLLGRCAPEDRVRIREVLTTITSGQELDLRRFGEPGLERIVALQTDAELDDYTYRVAGCVGEFWTRVCRAHLFPNAPMDDAQLLADGVRFGKGLQLVNILRDIPADLRLGRCYLPEQKLSAAKLSPADLLNPANEPRFRPLYQNYLTLAEGHLAAGWAYTNALPRNCIRVRLACAWPILIGMRTLEKLRPANVLDAQQRIKISRAEVRQVIMRSVLSYPWRRRWERLFRPAPCCGG